MQVLFAQTEVPKPEAGKSGQQQDLPFFMNPMFIILAIGLYFVIVILPGTRRQRKEQEAMLNNLKAGKKIVTTSGIVGTVTKATEGEDEIIIRTEDTRLRILRSTVARIVGDESAEVKS